MTTSRLRKQVVVVGAVEQEVVRRLACARHVHAALLPFARQARSRRRRRRARRLVRELKEIALLDRHHHECPALEGLSECARRRAQRVRVSADRDPVGEVSGDEHQVEGALPAGVEAQVRDHLGFEASMRRARGIRAGSKHRHDGGALTARRDGSRARPVAWLTRRTSTSGSDGAGLVTRLQVQSARGGLGEHRGGTP